MQSSASKHIKVIASGSLLEAAVAYFELGLKLTPCGPSPAYELWQEDLRDRRRIETLFSDDEVQIGILCRSSNIVVLDVEAHHALRQYVRDRGLTLPVTFTVRTPSGGLQYYYRATTGASYPEALCPGVRINGNGTVIAAPSLGRVGDSGAGRYSVIEVADIAPAPEWLTGKASSLIPPSPALAGEAVKDGIEIWELLQSISPDLPYDQRMGVLVAVHQETQGADPGLHLAIEWSQGRAGFTPGEIECKWPSLAAYRACAGETLATIAMTHGADLPAIRGRAVIRQRAKLRKTHDQWTLQDLDLSNVLPLSPLSDLDIERDLTMFEDTSSDALDVPVAGAIRILPPPTPAAMKRVEEFCFSALPADAAKPRLTQNHLIEGILQHPSLAVLYGPPGAGKTFYALGMAHAVASGEAFGEHKVRQGAVIYISAEGTGGIENRLAAIPGPRSPKLVVLRSQVDLYSSDADASAIVAYAQRVTRTQGKVGLIVIDTLAQCFGGGDENTAADMGVVLNRIAAIKDTLGATVVIIHHTGKDTERGARGSSTLPAKAETVLEVRREGDHIEVRATKQRDLELGWKHYFCLETVELGLDDGRRRVTSCHIKFVEGNSSVTAKAGGFAQAAVLKLLPAFLAAFGTEYRLSEGCDAGGLIQKADREAFRRYALSLSASDFKGKLTPRNVNEAISSLLKRGVLQGSGDEIWLKA